MNATATSLLRRLVLGTVILSSGWWIGNAAGPQVTSHSPSGNVDATDVTSMTLVLDAAVVADDAQNPASYQFLDLGADHQPGGGDDQVMGVQPSYASGGTEIELLFVGDTQVDLSQWVERDYASGGSGDWRIEGGGTSVKQYINGDPTYFVSDFDFVDREFVGRIKVETTSDDDFIGLVFAFQTSAAGKPENYYLFTWKRGNQSYLGYAEQGFKLLRISDSAGGDPGIWDGENNSRIQVLARSSSAGWAANTEYDFSVRYQSNGQIDVAIRRTSTKALLWSASVTDPSPLGAGKVGFFNYSQSDVRYSGLNQVDFLEEGAYQLTAYSGNPGLRGTDGTFLDGNGDGTVQTDDDFVTTLVIDHSDPIVTDASIQPTGITVEFYDLGGIDVSTVEDPLNYTVTASGGDGILGNGNDVVMTVVGVTSQSVGATTTATLNFFDSPGDDHYHLVVDGTASVRDLAGHTLSGGDYETDLELLTGPAVVTLDLVAASDSGVSDSDELTNDATPTFAVEVNKAGRVELDVDGDSVADHAAWATGPTVLEFTASPLADGLHTASVTFTPAVGSVVTASLDLTIDTQGPFVLPGLAEEPAPLFARTVTFSEPIDFATVDPLQVTMTAPNGADVPLLSADGSGAVVTLEFAAITLPGEYNIHGHVEIADLAGNPSNQDQDGTSGESGVDVPHDTFLLLADVAAPYVVRFAPTGLVNQDVSLFEVEFNEAMDVASFTAADLSLVTPGGAVDPSLMTVTPVTSRLFQVTVPLLSDEGQYEVTVGPTIRDLAGNTMAELLLVDDQSFDTQPASWVFHGNASWNAGGFARITPATSWQGGAAYFGTPQSPAPFIVEFDFNLNNGGGAGGGADGLVFVCAENAVLGGSGGGIGYSGALGTSFGVEFDTYNNGGVDPGNNHVAFDWNGAFRATALVVNGPWMVNSGTHHAVIRFDGVSRVDLTLTGPAGDVTAASYDLPPEAIPSQYTFGFTSATGAGWANHDVDNVQVHLLTGGSNGAFATSFVIDKTGPVVVDMSPAGTLPVAIDYVDVTFDSPVLPASFGVADVQLTGPAGAVASVVDLGGGEQFRINFSPALNAIGDYAIRVGPDVTDLAGNAMDQNTNGTNGEDPDDTFVGNLAVVLPDLQVTQVSVPGSGLFGGVVRVDYRLRNGGSATAAGPWRDGVYWSPDAIGGNGNDVALQTRPSGDAAPLGAGAEVEVGLNVTLPSTGYAPGTYYLLVRTDVYGEQGEGDEGNNWSAGAGLNVGLPPRPDLVVEEVVAPASAQPGVPFFVTWKTRNVGAAAASGSWSERVYLSEDAAIGGDATMATVNFAGTIAPGDVVPRSAQVTLAPNGLGGTLRPVVATDIGGGLIEENEGNNVTMGSGSVQVPLLLQLVAGASSVAENGSLLGFTVSRNGPKGAALTVNLSSSDTTELTLPGSVEIAAGATSAGFSGTPQTDGIPDGDQTVSVGVSAAGYVPTGAASVVVRDVDLPVLTLTLSPSSAGEGEAVAGSVSRDAARDTALTVTLSASVPGQLELPGTVTIPANAVLVDFVVRPVQDTAIEPDTTYTVSASAPGAVGDSATLEVVDDDLPFVSLTLAQETVSEGDGANATTATLTRSIVSNRPLTVMVENSDATAVLVPERVTIPADQPSVSFPVAAVDDDLVDGAQQALLETVILVNGTEFAMGGSVPVTVTDDDGPTLRLVLAEDLVPEGVDPATSGTVSRNTDPTDALVVTLSSDAPGEVSVPLTVEIPAGETSVSFDLASLDDGVSDGNVTVAVLAEAAGFTSGTDTVVVSDVDLPDLRVESITPPGSGASESLATVTYRIRNQGPSGTGAGKTFVQRLYLSTDAVVGNDKFLSQYIWPADLPSGQFFDVVHSFYLPRTTGQYWLVVKTDEDGAIGELLENNNAGVSAPIQVNAAYTASVATDVEEALAGTPVPLSGRAYKPDGTGVAFGLVNLHVSVRGTTRVFSALCDELGNYTATFTPLPGEAGVYGVGADHPGVSSTGVQDTFTLLGMAVDPARPALQVVEGQSAETTATLSNLSDVALNGLTLEVSDNLPNVTFSAELDDTFLAGLGTRTLTLRASAADASYIGGGGTVTVRSVEGAELVVPVRLGVTDLRPKLVATPGRLVAGMKRGSQVTVELGLRNDGGEATGVLDVQLPPLEWMSATVVQVASLAPGEATSLMLVLTPPADLPLGPYNGSIGFGNATYGISVPFEFRSISEAKGDLRVVAVDEYTYYAEGSPKVAGASVTVRDAYNNQLVASGTTDVNGVAQFLELTEGYYTVRVSADKHSTYSEVHFVNPGTVTYVEAFLYRQTVEYNWTVVPVEIEDRYKITIETTFETFVPMPVVTLEPSSLDLNDYPLPEQQILVTVKNSGLIAAQGAKLQFGSHPYYEIIPLVEDVGLVPAMGEVKVPVIIRNNAPKGVAALAQTRAVGTKGGVPCTISAGLEWFLVCGPDNKYYWVPIPILNVKGDCFGSGGGGGWGWGGWGGWGGPTGGSSGPGGGSYYTPPSGFGSPDRCKPCKEEDYSEDDCFEKDFGVDISSVADALTSLFSAVPGVDVEGSAKIEAKAKVCPCCFEGGTSLRGSASGSASVGAKFTIPIAGAPKIDFEQNLGNGYTASGFFTLGTVDTTIDFNISVGGTATMECRGSDYDVCAFANASLSPSLNATAGIEGTVTGPNGFSQTIGASASASLSISFTGNVQKCLKGGTSGNLCVEPLTASCSASLNIPGVYSGEISASKELTSKVCLLDSDGIHATGDPRLVALALADAPGQGPALAEAAAPRPAGRSVGTKAGEGVCATVKLRLEQEAVLTRNAFNATLELINNDQSTPIEDVLVQIDITDVDGNPADDVFAIRDPELSGIGAVDGTGSVGTGSTGTASWILIPTREAAPETEQVYLVGGTLQYKQDGLQVLVPLTAVPITVYPDPLLYVKYFHQRDVYADDPFTPQIEPSIPYSLAVMVENRGKGEAKSFRITSAQPQIIENEKGLLIDFQIIATQVENDNLSPSLTVNLGNIPPETTKIARWLLTSTLQGLFIDYTVTFEHVDAIAGKKTALIDEVSIHELTHIVEAPDPYADGRPDFLVNDEPDPPTDYPDVVHLSDGSIEPVSVVIEGTVDGAPSAGDPQVVLTVDLPPGFVYVRVPEPSNGTMELFGIEQDGRMIPVGINAWTTDRTFVGEGKRPVNEHVLHLFDLNGAGSTGPVSYTLIYEELPPLDTVAPVSLVEALPTESAAQFAVNWSGTDDGGSGVSFFDVYVSEDGGPFTLWRSQTKQTGSLYTGQVGRAYGFYSRATDLAGNTEAAPGGADAMTTVLYQSTDPDLAPIAAQNTDEGMPILDLALSVTDPDTAPEGLSFQVSSSNRTLLPEDNILLGGTPGARTLILTPVAQRFGQAEVTVSVSDGRGSDVETFLVNVTAENDPPVPGADSFVRQSGRSLKMAVAELLANDNDPDTAKTRLGITGVSGATPAGATVRLAGQWVIYEPAAGQPDAAGGFTYDLTDGETTVPGTVTITVEEAGTEPGQNRLGDPVVAGGTVTLTYVGIPGREYALERTTDVGANPVWEPITTAVAGPTGLIQFVDEHPPGVMAYYRTVDLTAP